MGRLKHSYKGIKYHNPYDYSKNLNWRDDGNGSKDGQGIEDPSMNDFLKGYNMDPYEFRQWAKTEKNLEKKAWTEVDVVQFTPEYLADKILKLWNAADGLLQNFFDSFTLRYNNNLKKTIADELDKKGYKVYPLLIEDKPIYAKHKKILKKLAKKSNLKDIIAYSKIVLSDFEEVQELIKEVEELDKIDEEPVSKIDVAGILDYYKLIYPESYALGLINIIIDEEESNDLESKFSLYKDFSISDEALDAMQNYMSGNADPTYRRDGGIGGYDFTTDTRSDGTAPNSHETRVSKKKL